jgi:putative membrane protein
MKQQTQNKINSIQPIPSTEMGISKEGTVWNTRTHLSAAAAVIFAVALHPAIAKAQGVGAPTDPQIVGIVETADQIDINYAKLALAKAKDKQVKDFAQQMITDHSAVQKAVVDLAAKLHVTPADSQTSDSLKTQAQQTTQKLRGLKGKQFEKAHVDNEVAYHKAVINATKTVLIPSAQNADLKSALQGAEPLFQGHLAHAERVQSAIEGVTKTASK